MAGAIRSVLSVPVSPVASLLTDERVKLPVLLREGGGLVVQLPIYQGSDQSLSVPLEPAYHGHVFLIPNHQAEDTIYLLNGGTIPSLV